MQNNLALIKRFYISESLVSIVVKALVGSIFMALCAQISIPLQPVPITGQTLGLTVVGFALGARAGTAALILYLLEGAAGLPVFANGSSGLQTFFGPTGGYLIGYIPSAFVLGLASDYGVLQSPTKTILAALLSAVITFAFGLAQLQYVVRYSTVEALLNAGLTPFILGGVIKALIASAIVIPAYNFFKKI